LRNQPQRLLLITTENIGNAELSQLIAAALPAMVEAFGTARYVEISHNSMIIHE
jgi:predicted nuclease of predicted toxin-antitoxin system